MMSSIKITVSILTYNRCNILKKVLDSLIREHIDDMEIIVVDNNSEDETEEVVNNRRYSINYIKNDKNIGVFARNIGMSKAQGRYIITLDDDIDGLNKESIDKICNIFDNNKEIGAINFKVNDYESGEICNWVHHCKSEKYHDKKFDTYEITEGAVAFRKKAIELVGGYSNLFFIGHEGPDLAFRLMNAGYRVIYSGDILVKHHFCNNGRASWRNYYFDTRNSILLAVRNMPAFYGMKYLSKSILSMLIFSVRDGLFKYWLKGLYDGVMNIKLYFTQRNVLSHSTMLKIKNIDNMRPGLIYMIKKRLFRSEIYKLK